MSPEDLEQITVVSDPNCLNRLLDVSATRVQELTQDMREDVSCCSNMHLTAGQHAKGSDMCKAARPLSSKASPIGISAALSKP